MGSPRHRIASVIDPLERWRTYGEKHDYAGLLTFSGMPNTQDPAELAGADIVEVIPTGVGSADITALVAERIVREIVTGVAIARR
jgi:hypothetical protein